MLLCCGGVVNSVGFVCALYVVLRVFSFVCAFVYLFVILFGVLVLGWLFVELLLACCLLVSLLCFGYFVGCSCLLCGWLFAYWWVLAGLALAFVVGLIMRLFVIAVGLLFVICWLRGLCGCLGCCLLCIWLCRLMYYFVVFVFVDCLLCCLCLV